MAKHQRSLEVQVDVDARSSVIAVRIAIAVALGVVIARVAPAVVTARTPGVPSVPVAVSPIAPMIDLFNHARLHLLEFRHKDRRGV